MFDFRQFAHSAEVRDNPAHGEEQRDAWTQLVLAKLYPCQDRRTYPDTPTQHDHSYETPWFISTILAADEIIVASPAAEEKRGVTRQPQ